MVRASQASNDWLLWQLVDSAFPTGGFAHSGGMEAAWQAGEIARDEDRFLQFITTSLRQTVAGSFPYVRDSHADPERFERIDCHCDAFLSNRVANRASRAQGSGFLATATKAFPATALRSLRTEARRGDWPCHLPVVHGVVTARMNISREQALRSFLFVTLRALLSSAIRLSIIGPLRCQAIQYEVAPLAERLLQDAPDVSMTEAVQIVPEIDLLQASHDRLYSRLFHS